MLVSIGGELLDSLGFEHGFEQTYDSSAQKLA